MSTYAQRPRAQTKIVSLYIKMCCNLMSCILSADRRTENKISWNTLAMHHPSFTQIDLAHKGLGYVSMQGPCGVPLAQADQEMFLLAQIQTIPWLALR